MATVFYSWQLDTEPNVGRNFIGIALKDAVEMLKSDVEVEEAHRDLTVDSDTQGISGSPPIVETIFAKIDMAAAFVADLTFVGRRINEKLTPNPNVAIEYGYALKTLTHSRMIGVMNEAYGEPTRESLPFDLGHLRFPITYRCPDGIADAARRHERAKLAEKLKGALKAILESAPRRPLRDRVLHSPLPAADHGARFRGLEQDIGVLHDGSRLPREQVPVVFAPGAAMWLRLMPKYEIGKQLLNADLREAFLHEGSYTLPLNGEDLMNPHGVRGHDGYGIGLVLDGKACMLVYAFARGEVWSMDTTLLEPDPGKVFFSPEAFARMLTAYAAMLGRLGVDGPYRWMAGIHGIKGRRLQIMGKQMTFPPPPFLVDAVIESGDFSGRPEDAVSAIDPFVSQVFDAGDVPRSRSTTSRKSS